jgi:hypothetical protein
MFVLYMKRILPVFLLLITATSILAQVDAIKSSSSSNSSNKSNGGRDNSGSSNGAAVYFFLNFMVNNIAPLQIQTLQKKTEIPQLVSLELRLQTGLQPSTYYLALPRIRANWGLFSTDYRRSYLVEANPLGPTKDISWNDWQILQLNLVNTSIARFRVGAGIMNEVFNTGQTFTEYTMALALASKSKVYDGEFEFRQSSNLATGATPRWELNAHVNKKLFDRNKIHGYLTGGGVFQEYYGNTDVWAFTAGLAFKLY